MSPSPRRSKKPTKRNRRDLLKSRTKIMTQKYELLYNIGRGGFSEVYFGVERATQTGKYAIKVNYSTVAIQQALEELKCLVKINGNQYFPKLVDAFIEGNHVYIVQEYIHYTKFDKRILKKISLDDAKHYLLELLKALKALKEHKIYHCDIKPQNFLFDMSTKRGVLVDFGLAQNVQKSQKRTSLQLRASVTGTKQYVGLERFFNCPYTYASEIWSVGVIMLQLMTKKINTFNSCQAVRNNYEYFITFILELSLFYKEKLVKQCEKWGFQLKLPEDLGTSTFSEICKIQGYDEVAENLLLKMLDINPKTRITVQQAINHQFFSSIKTELKQVHEIKEAMSGVQSD